MSSNLKDISNAIADVIGESIDQAIDSAIESHMESAKVIRTIDSAIESAVENFDFSDVIDEDTVNTAVDIPSMVESEIESQVESKVEGIISSKAEEWEANLESHMRIIERLDLELAELKFKFGRLDSDFEYFKTTVRVPFWVVIYSWLRVWPLNPRKWFKR